MTKNSVAEIAGNAFLREANAPPGGVAVRGIWRRRLVSFAMIAGPGLIVMVSDNDAGAVSTYTEAGAKYGNGLLWLLLLLLPCTYFIQEMVARLGIATGEGHAAMIYKRFGTWWGIFSLFDLLLVNFLTLVTEFAAIALAFSKMGVSPFIAVPLACLGLIVLATTGSYRRWERTTLVLCALNLTWIWLAMNSGTPLNDVARHVVTPQVPNGRITSDLMFIVIAIVGTTIAPWQLFFQQSCVADKRLRFSDLGAARVDTLVGAIFVIAFAGCMMLVGNLARLKGISYEDPAQMATALAPSMGVFFKNALLLMMVNAALLGATAISLSSSWAYGEVKGWPHSLQLKLKNAPGFYGVYLLCILAAGAIVLIPGAPLQLIILSVQVLAGVMLPSAIIFLQLLLNDKELLGDRYINKPWNNWVNWTIIFVLFCLSLILAAQVVAPSLFPK
jgi:Mn2+/Fe2+ NRAMP family transporter